ncbi:glutaredoxin family protein [Pontibacillus litoralis]|uniref:Glutaredoxin n=1 Tax=Pontibacillus litoralis JSM 072002 TaxID=1385512 RepID=A0A0A5FZF6_9BACI|nr:glutaredoxin family protein [Pontibacillus litoralis]KGX86221.1 glutaredoxin [Pontibacillus litoralis JSM 072002]
MNQYVVLYGKPNCPLCEEAKEIIKRLKKEYDFNLIEKDIYADEQLLEKYMLKIPVIEMNGKEVDYGRINEQLIRNRLQ